MEFSTNIVTDAKRVVIKIGSSSLSHTSGKLNFHRIELLSRTLSDFVNSGKQIILVSSGAITAGRAKLNFGHKPASTEEKQALAAIGQAELMRIYERFFSSYGQNVAQVLITREVVDNNECRQNAKNTFEVLLNLGCVPIVNENDTISTDEIEFGDNDTLSALVAALTGADMLILLSDIDGLFTDDPNQNPNAEFIDLVEKLDSHLDAMAKDTSKSSVGTGGMATKLKAAHIATSAGADMVIANGNDFHVIHKIMQGRNHGTLFLADKKEEFYLDDIIDKLG